MLTVQECFPERGLAWVRLAFTRISTARAPLDEVLEWEGESQNGGYVDPGGIRAHLRARWSCGGAY